jgi:hypothetical protein
MRNLPTSEKLKIYVLEFSNIEANVHCKTYHRTCSSDLDFTKAHLKISHAAEKLCIGQHL